MIVQLLEGCLVDLVACAKAGCDPHSSVTCASSIFGGFAAKFAEAARILLDS
jgi:hypothetical protein